MVAEERVAQHDFRHKIQLALEELGRWREEWAILARKVERSRTSWLMPGIYGPLDQAFEAPDRPERISVAATDGSQIFPDRHEIASCYLINIGYILLHYGTGEKPLMSSKPSLFFKEDELEENWGGRRTAASRDLVGFRRGLMEFTELTDLAILAGDFLDSLTSLRDFQKKPLYNLLTKGAHVCRLLITCQSLSERQLSTFCTAKSAIPSILRG